MRAVRHGTSDPPHPDDAKRLARHRTADKMRRPPAGPRAGAKLALALAGAAAEHQHDGECQVSGGIGQDTRGVRYGNAGCGGGGQIDVVHPDTIIGDHPAASVTAGTDHIAVNHVRNGRGGDVMASEARYQLFLGQWHVILVQGDIEMRGKRLFSG